jgi:hypothetical protein
MAFLLDRPEAEVSRKLAGFFPQPHKGLRKGSYQFPFEKGPRPGREEGHPFDFQDPIQVPFGHFPDMDRPSNFHSAVHLICESLPGCWLLVAG